MVEPHAKNAETELAVDATSPAVHQAYTAMSRERPRAALGSYLLWKNMIKDRQITCRNLGMHESLVDDFLKSPDGYENEDVVIDVR